MKDSEPVRLWRDFSKLNISQNWKHDVDITVTDIELWKSILAGWKWQDAQGRWHKKHPGIKNLLAEYERLSMNGRQNVPAAVLAQDVSVRSEQSLPARSLGRVPEPPVWLVLERKISHER